MTKRRSGRKSKKGMDRARAASWAVMAFLGFVVFIELLLIMDLRAQVAAQEELQLKMAFLMRELAESACPRPPYPPPPYPPELNPRWPQPGSY